MKDIVVFGTSYSLPEIRDERFESLQAGIRETRERIEEGSAERRVLGFIRKPPALDADGRMELMEELVDRYDEFVDSLRGKISGCSSAFNAMGDGVKDYFGRKVAELEAMEARRAALAQKARAAGQAEVAASYEGERERIRALALNLTRASVLIIRKLRHALEALETLVDDEASQRRVLESLKGSMDILREARQFQKDLDRIEDDIAKVTSFALKFESILRDKLGPLSALIDEISKVDGRVAESLVEIQRLSAQLEARQTISLGAGRLDERMFEALVRSRVRRDALDGIIAAMGDNAGVLAVVDFDAALSASGPAAEPAAGPKGLPGAGGAGGDLDFRALAENMGELVSRGLADLRRSGPAEEAAGGGEDAAVPGYLTPRNAPEAGAGPVLPPPAPELPAPVPVSAAAGEPATPAASAAAAAPAAAPAWIEAIARGAGAEPAPAAPRTRRAYAAAISRVDPTLLVFLLDRSGSMEAPFAGEASKAGFLARTVDTALMETAVRCTKADGTRDYFHVACFGYGNGKIASAFAPPLDAAEYVPISAIAARPWRIETGAAGTPEPRWIEPLAEGDTPMKAAFERACRFMGSWCDAHPRSYPPTLINVSDGESTDGDPGPAAALLRQLHTEDGECLVFNLHVSVRGGAPVVFPERPDGLDEHGRRLFEMSSPFPPHLLDRAAESGFRVGASARFFAYGAGAELATRFVELGTRPARLA